MEGRGNLIQSMLAVFRNGGIKNSQILPSLEASRKHPSQTSDPKKLENIKYVLFKCLSIVICHTAIETEQIKVLLSILSSTEINLIVVQRQKEAKTQLIMLAYFIFK